VPALVSAESTPAPEPASLAASSDQLQQPEPAVFDAPAGQARSEFVPLFYGGDPQLIESAQVWRVEMPRAALQSVGLPVAEESLSSRVQVDILLGEDGIARAIRLVQ
jgi:hypothetical protein